MKRDSNSAEKLELHPRNKHRFGYDFEVLQQANPTLKKFVKLNQHQSISIDFADADAVFELNRALLFHFYALESWSIPKGFLCPPIPGRADYLHYAADLLATSNHHQMPIGTKVRALDIGVGASCIYPIIGHKEYNWNFVGSDISETSITSAQKIVQENGSLSQHIELRHQKNKQNIFKGIVNKGDYFDLTICNPPFHASAKEAEIAASKKVRNLHGSPKKELHLNFGGQFNELYCEGGELQFIQKMILESKAFAKQICWFTVLVSKQSNLKAIESAIRNVSPSELRIVEMKQGNKISRFVAWTFLSETEKNAWMKSRWC
jgi:23S rRNA (adenine1618-N6)-methyltransferase